MQDRSRFSPLILLVLVIVLLVTGLAAAGAPSPAAAAVPDARKKVTEIREYIARTYDVDPDRVRLVKRQRYVFSDGCLDLELERNCLSVLTPGHRMKFKTPVGMVTVHADRMLTFYGIKNR